MNIRRIDDASRRPPQTLRAWQAVALTALTLAMAAVLTSHSLVRGAETKPFGAERDRWLAAWRPFERTGDALRLDRPRAWLDELTDDDGAPAPVAAAAEPPPASDLLGLTAAAAPTPEPRVASPRPARHLRLWTGGDSLAEVFSESLARTATDTGAVDAQLDARVSTGLTRPDYFDWATELARIMATQDPDVVVVVFGANDSQGIRTPDGQVFQALTDGWRAEYRRRAGALMDRVRRPGRLLVWVGLPPMRSADFDARMAEIDRIDREEASRRPGVVYIDARKVLGDASGKYAAYLADGDGHQELVREPDGVHVTRAGGDRLAAAVWYAIVSRVDFSRVNGSQ